MVNVRQYLGEMKFPANKKQIIDYAKEHNAPQDFMRSVEGLQDRNYNSLSEVTRAVSLF